MADSDPPKEWHQWRGEVSATLKSIDEKTTSTNQTVGTLFSKFNEHSDSDDERFFSIEKKLAWWSGAIAVVSGVAGASITWLFSGGK